MCTVYFENLVYQKDVSRLEFRVQEGLQSPPKVHAFGAFSVAKFQSLVIVDQQIMR